jgi:hypothetical protein
VLGVLPGDGCCESRLFAGREPLGILDLCIQEEEHGDANDDGEHSFEAEQPLPAAQAQDIVQAQEQAGDGAGQGSCHRGSGDEDGGGLAALAGGDPAGEVEDDGREEACFRSAQQEPQDVEHRLVLDERHQEGHDAPADHDPGQPDLGAVLFHHHVARKLEDGVGDEEQPGAEAVGRGADADVSLQMVLGVADVGPVQLVAHEHDQHDGQHAPEKLLHGRSQIRDSGVYRLHGGILFDRAARSGCGDYGAGRCGPRHSTY